jgi:hypothetical protein
MNHVSNSWLLPQELQYKGRHFASLWLHAIEIYVEALLKECEIVGGWSQDCFSTYLFLDDKAVRMRSSRVADEVKPSVGEI